MSQNEGRESPEVQSRDFSRLRISEFTQNFWVFSFYIADFWQTFWVIWENGSNWSNLRLKMSVSALKKVEKPQLHPNSTIFMPLNRLQLKMYVFSGKFNVCSKCVLLSWMKICRDLCSKLRFLLRNTGVDSDFTQNFWGKIWRLGSLFWTLPLPREFSAFGLAGLFRILFS